MRFPPGAAFGDWLLATALTVLTLATLAGQVSGRVSAPAVLVSALTVAPVALRQRAPVASTAVILLALCSAVLLGYGDLPSAGIGMVIGVFSVATLRPRWMAAVATAASLGVIALTYATTPTTFVWSQPAQGVLTCLGAWVLGESTKQWGIRTRRLAAQAERAVADERVRIARELHDVVAHHISVISLQAGVAEYVLDSDRSSARTAIEVVNRSGREALAEMRRLLGVLLGEGDDAVLGPQPGLADLDELISRVGAAGVRIEKTVSGPARELSTGAALCAYRMVQEALTNVLKHAHAARVSVDLAYGERWIDVTVADDGRGAPPRRPAAETGPAHGLRGMRGRAELYGGELTAGPCPGGGFSVRLSLPLDRPS